LINTIKLQSAAALVGGQGDLLFVITDTAEGIKNAYAAIKQAAFDVPDMQLRIVVESDTDMQAHRAFRSLAQTTERFFRVQPRFALRLPQKWKVNATTAELVRIAMSSWNLAEYIHTAEDKHFSVK
jgi:MinD-like ATPase involved in chromosome partitioning or flagellar assembly